MSSRRQRGLTIIELVVFIVVLSIGLVGIMVLFNQVTRASPDPVVRKQALALAQSVMEEVMLRGFTYCDPDDAAVFTATGTGGCTTVEGIGPEGEFRTAAPLFDNVSDYNGFSMAGAGIVDLSGNTVSGLGNYSVSVAVAEMSGGELPDIATTNDVLRVTVTVSHAAPLSISVALTGYRTRYAPNSP